MLKHLSLLSGIFAMLTVSILATTCPSKQGSASARAMPLSTVSSLRAGWSRTAFSTSAVTELSLTALVFLVEMVAIMRAVMMTMTRTPRMMMMM